MCHLHNVSSGRFPGYEGEKKYPVSFVKYSLQAERVTADEGQNVKTERSVSLDTKYGHFMSADDSSIIAPDWYDNNFNSCKSTIKYLAVLLLRNFIQRKIILLPSLLKMSSVDIFKSVLKTYLFKMFVSEC